MRPLVERPEERASRLLVEKFSKPSLRCVVWKFGEGLDLRRANLWFVKT